jgi:gamma-glutamylcyclotransferase (GGCT)/AIG2-like uncharacterized protein YtfP
MNNSLFVYGTLMVPEIQEALLQRKVESKDAILEDFSANCIIYGQYITEYPFLKPSAGISVKGKIIYPISGMDLSLIKFYEGSEYILANVSVTVDGKDMDVPTFMLKKKDRVEYGPLWEYNKFVSEYLESYKTDIIPQLLRNYNM